jgi:hypothetical protein
MDVRFCFRIKAEAGMARDLETGEPTECYSQIKLGLPEIPPPERYTDMHQSLAERVAGMVHMPVSMFELIMPEEYDAEVEEEI